MAEEQIPDERPESWLLLRNDQDHHAVWPSYLPVPEGWRQVGEAAASAAEAAAALDGKTAQWRLGRRPTVGGRQSSIGPGAPPATVSARVRSLAQSSPNAPAVLWEGGELPYRALDDSADSLACRLRERGVEPGAVVAVCLGRVPELVVSLLAVQRTGAAFLPLDPAAPARRLTGLTAEVEATHVLTSHQYSPLFGVSSPDAAKSSEPGAGAAGAPRVLAVEDLLADPADEPDGQPQDPDPAAVAYVIFTSGSTGPPKGVAITHHAWAGALSAAGDFYDLAPGDRVLHLAALGFDTSLEQLFAPLINGAATVLTGPQVWAPTDLLQGVPELGVTVVDLTPAYWRRLLDLLGPGQERLSTVRLVILGGETVHAKDCHAWLRHFPGTRLVNAYGLTETVITSTVCELNEQLLSSPGSAPAPVGQALPGAHVHVLDPRLRPVAPGERGEVWIGGTHLAEGIWDQPGLTALQFLPDPYAKVPGARMYRTGDTGRWRTDGNLEILGRVDEQVKIRGFRVDPAEVESVLRSQPGVAQAVVTARPGPQGQELELAAFYTRCGAGTAPQDSSPERLRAALAELLPAYMVPRVLAPLSDMPLTPNGKIDRKAMPQAQPVVVPVEEGAAPPAASLQAGMAQLWERILDVPRIRAEDDFFELGGNSLLAMEMLARARVMFGIGIDQVRELARALLHHSTLSAFAEHARQARAGTLAQTEHVDTDFAAEAQLLLSWEHAAAAAPVWQHPGHVLLTGATGLCGSHMLAYLLEHTRARVHCLVRAADGEQAWERVRAAHQRFLRRDLPAVLRNQRILLVPGDLSRPRLGLPLEVFAELGNTVDLVYHLGGLVNFIYPYQDLRGANVDSVRELVRLAAPRSVPLHYASSLAVMAGFGAAGIRTVSEETPLDYADYLSVGYVETKWVAEAMLRQAAEEGVPVTVYRLQDITGSLDTGVLNTSTEICALIRFIADTGQCPAVGLPLDFLPADVFARAVGHISTTRPARGRVYHLTNPRPALISSLADCLRLHGYPVELVPYGAWVRDLIQFAAGHPTHPLTPFVPLFVDRCNRADLTVSEMYLEGVFPAFTRANAERALLDSAIEIPPVDLHMLDTYVRFLQSDGYLPPPRGSLRGRGNVGWADLDLSQSAKQGPVAFGGDIGPDQLLAGYEAGAFPMPAPDDDARALHQSSSAEGVAAGRIRFVGPRTGDPWAVAWYSPDPRPVLYPGQVHLSHRLARRLRNRLEWTTTTNRDFKAVVRECRSGRDPLWLTDDLVRSLVRLHEMGRAHSVEVWDGEQLIGGVFGIRIGQVFSMDSMFGRQVGAAQVAVADLARRFAQVDGAVLDAQWDSRHARAMGAVLLPRTRYLALLRERDSLLPPLPAAEEEAARLTSGSFA
ncbi:amino acid adenylation domain-containing protein [Streptacidiphilus melanogenes]|uniref:amino acid adenylation domain-containing protein n=1 Tax=Streptacidiphilus melanogenes TaxID=411235 RepID=UPI000693AF24|nr:amino acid adenylation domain-containing protein [Streptacidiphilus melanogenes]